MTGVETAAELGSSQLGWVAGEIRGRLKEAQAKEVQAFWGLILVAGPLLHLVWVRRITFLGWQERARTTSLGFVSLYLFMLRGSKTWIQY